MARILVVEDCCDTRLLIGRAIGDEHAVTHAGTIAEARVAIDANSFDLALIDLGLPDGTGFQLGPDLSELGGGHVAMLFVTACADVASKVLAFQIGADDYIEKPFDPRELRARVQARLRRTEHAALRVGDLRLDPLHNEVTRRGDGGGTRIELTPHEFRLLCHLAERAGEVVSRDALLRAVWGSVRVAPRAIDTHLSNLRGKLAGTAVVIEAMRGVGYRLRVLERADPSDG